MDDELKESLWYMTVALNEQYKDLPEKDTVEKIVDLLRKILRIESPDNGGCVGLYEGWLKEIQEAENQESC